jgi:general stress protein YciG
MASSKRGFAAMEPEERRRIASLGGQASPGFKDPSAAGKKGAAAQPLEAKQRGGRNSHKNR